MTDAVREKLKDLGKKRALQTAILTTPEYDRGRRDGYNDAIDDALKALESQKDKGPFDSTQLLLRLKK